MFDPLNLTLIAVAVLVLGGCVWRAAHPALDPEALDPVAIPAQGWRFAFGCLAPCWKFVLGLGVLIGAGAGLQAFFMYGPIRVAGAWTLPVASLLWQGLLASLTAALVAPVQVFVLSRITGAAPGGAFGKKRGRMRLCLLAAGYGFGVWLFAYALGVALKAAVLFTPAPANRIVGVVATVASFLLVDLLALVRPALAMGAAAPLRTGLSIALRNAVWLWLVSGLLLLPPFLLVPLMAFVPQAPSMLGPGPDARALTILLASVFSLFQFLAVEASTTIFCRRATLKAA
jgi:hypothetical protein